MNRRDLLKTTVATTLVSTLAGARLFAQEAPRTLRILILGGTRFVGPHVVETALARDHRVTIFNRGRTNPGRVKNVEVLQGDRDGKLDALKGGKWDVVFDTSAFVPRIVRLSAELLADAVSQYIYVSSISAYASFAQANDESSPVGKIADETVEKVDNDTYGPLKALCEQAAERILPGRVTTLRPGLIVGPDDNTDRFTYWPARIARGGEVLAPNSPADAVQFIDVRDLAEFTVLCMEQHTMGIYNLVTPPGMNTIGGVLNACVQASRSDAKLTWVPTAFLTAQKVEGWTDMPVWEPLTGESAGVSSVSAARALAAGLKLRPVSDTVGATLAWHQQRPAAEQAKLKAGISPEREREVLAAWHKSRGE